MEQQAKRSKSKQRRNALIFFVVNILVVTGVVLFAVLGEEELRAVSLDGSWWFLVAAASMFVVGMGMEVVRYMILSKKAINQFRPLVHYKVAALGRYYDAITPFAVGGQPFQVYHYTKYGINGGKATSIVAAKYVFSQMTFAIVATTFLFMNMATVLSGTDEAGRAVITVSAWIGYAVNITLVLIVVLVTLNRRIGTSLVAGCIKLFSKITRKDPNRMYYRTLKNVLICQRTMKKYGRSPLVWLLLFATSIMFWISGWMIPFFIYSAFMGWDATRILEIITLVIMTELAASIIPLPGGTGMSEISFTILFGALFAGGMVAWVMLIWRLLTYYIYILQGLIIVSYDYIKSQAPSRRRLQEPIPK